MATERFTIRGRLGAATLLPWIRRHADRIGVGARFDEATGERLAVMFDGPPDLLDAMEMGCLLGPIEVWIDSIRREPACFLQRRETGHDA